MKKNALQSIVLLLFTVLISSCSKKDVVSPTISIQSPDLNKVYIIDRGRYSYGPDKAILEAQATDNSEIQSITATVTNSDGVVVFEENSPWNLKKSISISTTFSTLNPGVYNVIYKAVDVEGNESSSSPRTFTYKQNE